MVPILYQNKDLIIYSYPLLMGLGWGVGHQIFFSISDIPTKFKNLLFWGLFIFSWVGSKLLYIFNSNKIEIGVLSESTFWTGGGFVFYGGFLLGFIYLIIYRSFRFPLTLKSLNALILATIFGHSIGRLGCFFAGCCFGEVTEKWWAINVDGVHRHPTQLFESFFLLMLGLFLLKKSKNTFVLPIYFISYGFIRILIEVLRGDEIRGHWGAFSPSQWISMGLISIGIILVFTHKFLRLDQEQVK
jgi:phosphatidylglycerol:prolipoprotein diacylglycerol transferase